MRFPPELRNTECRFLTNRFLSLSIGYLSHSKKPCAVRPIPDEFRLRLAGIQNTASMAKEEMERESNVGKVSDLVFENLKKVSRKLQKVDRKLQIVAGKSVEPLKL